MQISKAELFLCLVHLLSARMPPCRLSNNAVLALRFLPGLLVAFEEGLGTVLVTGRSCIGLVDGSCVKSWS